ncbi:threonine-phosphate decarboxylase CobD [Chitinimonas sp.]|uniref:threonine-phosphate decarboxylase CobD n=1 Tax=Chitinimonas sp. TaxID=1934313 RepID=UPI002F920C3D
MNPPQHGGDLQRAMASYGGMASDWLDCSSGISPYPYPLPPVPREVWQRLPGQDETLLAAARAYYGTRQLLALPGSQAAIALLPQLRARSRVGVITPAYAEHAWQWRQAGHSVIELTADDVEAQLPGLDVLVLVNPNNPTALQHPAARLLAWQATLAERGGWLLVDEAFADLDGTHSLLPHIGLPGLVVLRSVGKFFGLAGIRLGFAAAEPTLLAALQTRLGPWTVSAPAQWAGSLALQDLAWQTTQRQRLQEDSRWLSATLTEAGLAPAGQLPLLYWCPTPHAAAWQAALAREWLWCRRFSEPAGLRFGLVAQHQRTLFLRRLSAARMVLSSNPSLITEAP